ncbi:DNA adenine methylase [Bizionia paragorgiae]|uniref:DNA adenine methylase n=1 Tax=Bizionia paragorgiae TaxID=283786 RepID=UPI003A936CF3
MSKSNTVLKNETSKGKPFLRWTGSKSWLVRDEFKNYLPEKYNSYHECFLGGGSVFFYLNPKGKVFLSDINCELIETYKEIRDNLDLVLNTLKKFKNSEEEYYKVRKSKLLRPHTRAAKFIYLNRCSFNGIYRVNSKGEYNVPYGRRKNVDIVTEKRLREVSDSLQSVQLICSDYKSRLGEIKEGDLVFIDPPYTVAHENNGFIEYNQKLFSWEDQVELKKFIEEISNLGAYFILTNASHESIRDLYSGVGRIDTLSRYSQVGGRNKTRGMYNEVIIYNTRPL